MSIALGILVLAGLGLLFTIAWVVAVVRQEHLREDTQARRARLLAQSERLAVEDREREHNYREWLEARQRTANASLDGPHASSVLAQRRKNDEVN